MKVWAWRIDECRASVLALEFDSDLDLKLNLANQKVVMKTAVKWTSIRKIKKFKFLFFLFFSKFFVFRYFWHKQLF